MVISATLPVQAVPKEQNFCRPLILFQIFQQYFEQSTLVRTKIRLQCYIFTRIYMIKCMNSDIVGLSCDKSLLMINWFCIYLGKYINNQLFVHCCYTAGHTEKMWIFFFVKIKGCKFHEWLICFVIKSISFYYSQLSNSTLRKIQTLSSHCNHPNKHVHLYLPLNVPSILHSARLQYLTLNLLLLLSQCVCVSLSCSAWLAADSSSVCQCSGQAQRHLPSSTCSRQWLS